MIGSCKSTAVNRLTLRLTQSQYATLGTAPDVAVSVFHDLVGGDALETAFANDQPDARQAQVSIGLPGNFQGNEYFSLLRSIHHEVFVHAPQVLDGSSPRRTVGPNCPVAEGLVDMAAHASLKRSLSSGALPPTLAPFADAFERAADASTATRFNQPQPGASSNDTGMHNARRSGARIFSFIKAERGGDDDAIDYAIEAAMAFNLEDLDRDGRREKILLLSGEIATDIGGRRAAMKIIDQTISRRMDR